MTELEKYIIDQLKHLVPNAEALEVRATISDHTCSVEFFATIEGEKHQCFDMIDNGIIKEKEFDVTVKQLARYIRASSEYRSGQINKFTITGKTAEPQQKTDEMDKRCF